MPFDWNTNFANEDSQEKSRLNEESIALALVSRLQLGQDEVSFQDYLIMEGEDEG